MAMDEVEEGIRTLNDGWKCDKVKEDVEVRIRTGFASATSKESLEVIDGMSFAGANVRWSVHLTVPLKGPERRTRLMTRSNYEYSTATPVYNSQTQRGTMQ